MLRCKTLIAPLSTPQPSQHCSLPSHPCSWETKNCEKGKYNVLNSIFLHSFANFIRGTNSGDLMQLKPQDSVSCVLTIFTPQQGKACPYFRPFFLHWVMVGSPSGCPPALSCVFMDVHGRPSMGVPGVHGCPYKRQPLAARCIASLYLSAGRPGQQLLLVG